MNDFDDVLEYMIFGGIAVLPWLLGIGALTVCVALAKWIWCLV